MNLADYHAHPSWSSSRKKSAATKTLRSYWAEYEDPNCTPRQPTESMLRGSLCDAFITDSDNFFARYFVLPEDAPPRPTLVQLRAKNPSDETLVRIAYWERVDEQSAGKEVITRAQLSHIHRLHNTLLEDPVIGPILCEDVLASQVPHFWKAEGGYDARYLPDLETASGDLWDLKLTRSANPRWLKAQAYSLGYDIQADHYRQGYIDKHGKPPRRVGLIAYEYDWPHNCVLFVADDELLEHGHQRGEDAVQAVLRARERGEWPSYGEAAWKLPGYIQAGGSSEPESIPMDDINLF